MLTGRFGSRDSVLGCRLTGWTALLSLVLALPAGPSLAQQEGLQWGVRAQVVEPNSEMAVVALDGKIYVAGGRFGGGFRSEITAVLEVFDPKTNTWTTKQSMSEARSGLNGIEAEGCFHTFGGEHPNAGQFGVFPHHEVYDPATDTWHRLADLPIPVHGVTGLAYVNGWIHLPGGGTRMGGSSGSKLHQVVRSNMRCG